MLAEATRCIEYTVASADPVLLQSVYEFIVLHEECKKAANESVGNESDRIEREETLRQCLESFVVTTFSPELANIKSVCLIQLNHLSLPQLWFLIIDECETSWHFLFCSLSILKESVRKRIIRITQPLEIRIDLSNSTLICHNFQFGETIDACVIKAMKEIGRKFRNAAAALGV